MRLLNTETQELKFFPEGGRPDYAILSHTWEDDEVLFADIVSQEQDWRQKAGADKVPGSCKLAKDQGHKHIWIDTCCIDKNSSAELSEAINSMFNWYMNAEVCYVYLTDVAEDGSITECRWFKRGWTLQELIAPTSVDFYDKNWQFINDKISISSELARSTGIDESLLRCGHSLNPPLLKDHQVQLSPVHWAFAGKGSKGRPKGCSCGRPNSVNRLSQLQDYCVAQKMSWASTRETTRREDIAYCLMGLFGINMPLLYGEGRSRAFFRLQREIIDKTHDQSILAFGSFLGGESSVELSLALASHPDQFPDSGLIHFRPVLTKVIEGDNYSPMTTELTKFGVNVELLIMPEIRNVDKPIWFGILDFQMGEHPLGRPAILLHPVSSLDSPSVSCVRGEALYEISPEHPDHARDLRALTGRADLEAYPDRSIQLEGLKRQKVTILQNFDASGSSTYKENLPAPIQCVSRSPECPPYSVEAESGGRAILKKAGYPRLLVHVMKDDSVGGYSSLIWMLRDVYLSHGTVPDDDAEEDAGHILAKLKDYRVTREFGRVGLVGINWEFYHGSSTLTVRGPSDLNVEVRVTPVEFLDWKIPGVTVFTTQLESFKIEV